MIIARLHPALQHLQEVAAFEAEHERHAQLVEQKLAEEMEKLAAMEETARRKAAEAAELSAVRAELKAVKEALQQEQLGVRAELKAVKEALPAGSRTLAAGGRLRAVAAQWDGKPLGRKHRIRACIKYHLDWSPPCRPACGAPAGPAAVATELPLHLLLRQLQRSPQAQL